MQKDYNLNEAVSLDSPAKVYIVQSSWHKDYTNSMLAVCSNILKDSGVTDIEVFEVPGALEIPVITKLLAKRGDADAIICFGAIVRGETYHFEMVADNVAAGMLQVSYDFEVPVIQQVLAVDNLEQLQARSGDNTKNKGIEAAQAALQMIELLRGL